MDDTEDGIGPTQQALTFSENQNCPSLLLSPKSVRSVERNCPIEPSAKMEVCLHLWEPLAPVLSGGGRNTDSVAA